MVKKKKVAGIILAAGVSSRMGRTKQLLPFHHGTIIETVTGHACASELDQVLVVLGHHAQKIRAALVHHVNTACAQVIVNPHFKIGQSTSIVEGIRHLGTDMDAVMFLLGDQPLISASVINYLIEKYHHTNARIVVPYYQGIRGNPVIFDHTLFPELGCLKGDTGARVLFKKNVDCILKVSVDDPGIITDVDTPLDYKRLIDQRGDDE